jgi:hypothetical protein
VDPETTRTVITVGGGIVSALGGVGIGYALSQRSAAMDREFIERQRVRELQELGARDFSKALNEAGREVPTGVMRVTQSGRRIGETHREVREAWGEARSLFLRNSDIVRVVAALDCILLIAHQDTVGYSGDKEQNYYPIGLAFNDLQDALSAFIVREDQPKPRLPDAKKLEELAYPTGENLGLEGVRRWAAENGL